jgi:putative membrane protein
MDGKDSIMWKWLTLSAMLLLGSHQTLGQTNIKPETMPRLPPQPGQGLPVADQQFLERAANLSEAEIEAGRLGAVKATSPELKEISQQLSTDHQSLQRSLQGLAQKNRVTLQAHPSRQDWQRDLQRMRDLSGQEFDREYLRWQLQAHLTLVNLYQTEASQSPETDLARFAIVTLTAIQRRFDRAKQLGAEQGVAIDTIGQPPQY